MGGLRSSGFSHSLAVLNWSNLNATVDGPEHTPFKGGCGLVTSSKTLPVTTSHAFAAPITPPVVLAEVQASLVFAAAQLSLVPPDFTAQDLSLTFFGFGFGILSRSDGTKHVTRFLNSAYILGFFESGGGEQTPLLGFGIPVPSAFRCCTSTHSSMVRMGAVGVKLRSAKRHVPPYALRHAERDLNRFSEHWPPARQAILVLMAGSEH